MVVNLSYSFIPLQKISQKGVDRSVENPQKRAKNTEMGPNAPNKFSWRMRNKMPLCYATYLYRIRRVYERAHVDEISLDVISLKCEASESVQFSTCYDPIHRFWRVKTKSSFFSKIKTCLRKKKCTTFLVLLRSTCVQKLSQFEFLTLAIKISFLFDFCKDALLTT